MQSNRPYLLGIYYRGKIVNLSCLIGLTAFLSDSNDSNDANDVDNDDDDANDVDNDDDDDDDVGSDFYFFVAVSSSIFCSPLKVFNTKAICLNNNVTLFAF